MDGAVGSQVWMFAQKHSDFKLNIIEDANFLSGLVKAENLEHLMLEGESQNSYWESNTEMD